MMNELEVKALLERMVADLTGQAPPGETGGRRENSTHTGEPGDITAVDLRRQYLVRDPANGPAFLDLKARTPARIGLGRAGARYKTETMLRMRADHAAAQDSVFSHVDEDLVKGRGWVFTQTLCGDKDEYLTRPDRGRRFDRENQEIIQKTLGREPKVALVVGDGLSSAAIEANAADCLEVIRAGLKDLGIDPGPTLFVKYCRVGASDHIGELTGARVVCMLVGERPGLVTAESMSAYVTYGARLGVPESQRTVVSNIHRQGTPAPEAGRTIAKLIKTMLDRGASGVALAQLERGVGA